MPQGALFEAALEPDSTQQFFQRDEPLNQVQHDCRPDCAAVSSAEEHVLAGTAQDGERLEFAGMQLGESAALRANLRGLGGVAFGNVDESTFSVGLEINALQRHRVRVVVVRGLVEDLLRESYTGAGNKLVPEAELEQPDDYVGVK